MAAETGNSIGYKKPPENSRFRKGVSGNPVGRRKRINDFLMAFATVVRQLISIQENGRKRRVTKLQAIIIRLMNRAAAGDLSAIRVLARFQVRNGSPALERQPPQVEYQFVDDVEEA